MIDTALASDRTIVPSVSFRRSAMRRVRANVEVPPLPFPWKRLAAALGFAFVATVASIWAQADSAAISVDPIPLVPLVIAMAVVARLTAGRSATRTA